MSDIPYLGDSTDLILGQEFLTWLWYRSDTNPGFPSPDGGPEFRVSMEQRVVVQGGEGDARETASASGVLSELREARLGLATGKKVTRALVRLQREPESWQVTLRAQDFAFGSLKTPPIERGDSFDGDPDALFFEKVHLIELCLGFFDTMFKDFLHTRLSPEWAAESADVRAWAARNI